MSGGCHIPINNAISFLLATLIFLIIIFVLAEIKRTKGWNPTWIKVVKVILIIITCLSALLTLFFFTFKICTLY